LTATWSKESDSGAGLNYFCGHSQRPFQPLKQLKEVQMNRDELVTEVLTTTADTTKPAKLVLTKAEILAALAPLENIAKSIEANESAYLAWYETLPTKDGDDDDEEQIVEFPDADLELYDRICGVGSRTYNNGPLDILMSEIENSAEFSPLLAERRLAEMEAGKKGRAERTAATRNRNAKAKA
jgi:hypothetical protein